MISGKESMVSLHQDQRLATRYNSNSKNIPNKQFPWDLESSFQSLKEQFRSTHKRIYANFPPHREEDIENLSHASVLDIRPPKSAKPARRNKRTSSLITMGNNDMSKAYSSEYGAQAGFRDMKKVVQDRNKDVVLAKHHFNYMLDLKEEKEKNDQSNTKAIKTGVAFYSPYENKIEKIRKIANYKDLVLKERKKNVLKVTQYLSQRVSKQQDFLREKAQIITNLIEKKKATTFVLEQPNDTSVEQETSRSPSAKAKKRQISHYSVNSKNSPPKSRQPSLESLRIIQRGKALNKQSREYLRVPDSIQASGRTKESHRNLLSIRSRTRNQSEISPDEDAIKEEAHCESSIVSVLGSNRNNRKKPVKPKGSMTDLNLSTVNDRSMRRYHRNSSVGANPFETNMNKTFSGSYKGNEAIMSPEEYEIRLKMSKDLFTKSNIKNNKCHNVKETNNAIKHLNKTIRKINNSKQRINNKLENVLTKIGIDRQVLLDDKRKVVHQEVAYSTLGFLRGNQMRKKFGLSLKKRKERAEKQIQIYQNVLTYLKDLPTDFPLDKLEFLNPIKEKLEIGDCINKEFFLSVIKALDPESPDWRYQEPILLMFKDDQHINMSDFEYGKWRERQKMSLKEPEPLEFKNVQKAKKSRS